MISAISPHVASWATPRLDLGVLYAPLWRPDMVARGGRIQNGTGTLNGASLQALLVGVTTLTADVAGTFSIWVPYAATCASGTATITGSPVTLNPGLNSVTTGVTTGTFTVTTSNIIRSKDASSRQMTVTGATKGVQGRTFDGSDDKIVIANHASQSPTAAITILTWVKPDAGYGPGPYELLFSKAVGAQYYSYIVTATGLVWSTITIGGVASDQVSTNAVPTGKWTLVTVLYNGSAHQIYFDLTLEKSAAKTGAIATSTSDITLGIYPGTTDWPYAGIMGEFAIYDRGFSLGDIARYRDNTRWRYQ